MLKWNKPSQGVVHTAFGRYNLMITADVSRVVGKFYILKVSIIETGQHILSAGPFFNFDKAIARADAFILETYTLPEILGLTHEPEI